MLGVSVRKMKAPIFKIEMVTLIGKGTKNLTCFVYQVYEINSKIFWFITADVLFSGVCLKFGNIHFSLADMFYLGGHLRLQPSCNRINMVFQDVILMDCELIIYPVN